MMPHRHHRAPRECPVCSEHLRVTRLGCDNCGTGISGDFEQCEFCALDSGDRDVLRVFLASRGNIKELERHLGVSYPTARARFDDLIRKLGLATGAAPTGSGSTGPGSAGSASASARSGSGSGSGGSGAAGAGSARSGAASSAGAGSTDPRLRTLEALAAGELDVEQARRLIDGA